MDITIDFQSPEDAWLSGLSEAVKTMVPDGFPLREEEFKKRYSSGWSLIDFKLNLGRDVTHGIWHIVGWRMGVYLVLLTAWDITQINDDNAVAELWASIMDDDPEIVAASVADPLRRELGIDIVMLGPNESLFFKRYQN